MVEEHVVHREAGKGVHAGAQHRHVFSAGVTAHPQVSAPACHREFQAEQRHHQIRQPGRREQQAQPPEGTARQIKGVAVQKAAAQISGPAEGAAAGFYEFIGGIIKGDLLAVEVSRVQKKAFIHNVERQEHQRGGQAAQRKGKPVFVLWFIQWAYHKTHLTSLPLSPRRGCPRAGKYGILFS